MSDLLLVDEVAALTRVPLETLRYWRARGRGEGPASFRVGRRVVYRRSEVDRWLAAAEAAERTGARV